MFETVKDIDIAWLKENHQLIHYFGLGFIQLKINDTYRLHFYNKELPPIVDEEDIHNHRYNFVSKILKGKFEQSFWGIVKGQTHWLEPESCRPDFKPEVDPKECSIKFLSRHQYAEGSEYSLTSDVFHKVKSDFCITLLQRGPIVKELAEVVRAKDAPKICAFSKQVPDEELWQMIEDMLKK